MLCCLHTHTHTCMLNSGDHEVRTLNYSVSSLSYTILRSCPHAFATQSSHTSTTHTFQCIIVLFYIFHLCVSSQLVLQSVFWLIFPPQCFPLALVFSLCVLCRGLLLHVSISRCLRDYCYWCSVPFLYKWQAAAKWEHRFEIDVWGIHISLPGCLRASEVRESYSRQHIVSLSHKAGMWVQQYLMCRSTYNIKTNHMTDDSSFVCSHKWNSFHFKTDKKSQFDGCS